MRKMLIVFTLTGVMLACNNKKDDRRTDRTEESRDNDKDVDRDREGDKESSGKWSSSEVSDFNRDCEKSIGDKGLTRNQIDDVCACLLKKFEGKYDTYAEMDRKGTYEEGKQAGEECMKGMTSLNNDDNTGNWSSSDRQRWMDLCDQSVKNSTMSADRKERYCSCVLDKLQQRYANFDKMNVSGTEAEGIELGKACISEIGNQ